MGTFPGNYPSLPNSVVNKMCFMIFSNNNVALYVKCNFLKQNMVEVL